MENFNKIKQLKENADAIYELFNIKIPKWEADRDRYDKIRFGFNEDDRFMSCHPTSIFFSSSMGVYGSSSCSSELSLDKEIFSSHLIKYLNKNKKEIMLAIARQIKEEANGLKNKAEEELKTQLIKLNQI